MMKAIAWPHMIKFRPDKKTKKKKKVYALWKTGTSAKVEYRGILYWLRSLVSVMQKYIYNFFFEKVTYFLHRIFLWDLMVKKNH